MIVKLILNKDINFNANLYFEKSKKLKNKIPGILKILEKTKFDIEDLKKKEVKFLEKKKQEEVLKNIPKKWYEKNFRHTFTKNNFLFVIGKDSSSNEILIKKYMEKDDLIFHTEASGSPYGLLKNSMNKANDIDLKQASSFLASFSSAWSDKLGVCDVFYVKQEQISKSANTKEFLSKGSFMIRGNKNFIKNVELKISLGFFFEEILKDGAKYKIKKIISGEHSFIKNKCEKFLTFTYGDDNIKNINMKIKKKFGFKIDNLSHYIRSDNLRIIKN